MARRRLGSDNRVSTMAPGDSSQVTRLYAIRRGERPLIRAVGRVSHWTPEWSNSRSR